MQCTEVAGRAALAWAAAWDQERHRGKARHTTEDTLDKVTAASLQVVGDVALALVR